MTPVALRERLRVFELALPAYLAPTLLFAGFAVLFWLLGEPNQGDLHAELARSFLAGHLWVPADAHWELVPIDAERAWSPFPPIPALTYIPFVLLGIEMPVSLLTALVGAAGAALLFQLLVHLEVTRTAAGWITAGVIGLDGKPLVLSGGARRGADARGAVAGRRRADASRCGTHRGPRGRQSAADGARPAARPLVLP